MKSLVKSILLVLMMTIFVSAVLASDNKIVSVSDNFINISSQELADCHGAICEYTFTVQNQDSKDKQININNVFYSDNAIPLALYSWQDVTVQRSTNNPYECNCQQTDLNETNLTDSPNATTCQSCDNITYYDYTYTDWVEVSADKNSNEITKELKNTEDKPFILAKQSEQRYKVKVFVPLGQNVKYDIQTQNDDQTTTTLDPWINNEFYQINISNMSFNNGLISYYTFDNNTNDYNGNNNLATSGAYNINSAIAKLGNSIFFDNGGYAYKTSTVRIGSGAGNYTVCQWNYITSYPYDFGGMGSNTFSWTAGQFWRLDFKESGTTSYLQDGNGDISFADVPSTNTWLFHCAVMNSSGIKAAIFRNGILIKEGANGLRNIPATNMFVIHGNQGGSPVGTGYVDEVSVWNRSLNQTEILQLYNNGSGLSYSQINNINNQTIYTNPEDNLTINTTFTGVIVQYDSNVIQLNDTALGNNLLSGQCYNILDGQSALNWTVIVNNYTTINYTFTDCLADKSVGLQAVLDGISASKMGTAYSAYDDKTVYIRLANGSQYQGTFDKFIVSGNKRYAFNYDPNITSNVIMYNITPVFYVWQNINMSAFAIKNSVQSLIDSTY